MAKQDYWREVIGEGLSDPILLPRISQAQINTLPDTVPDGSLVFNTDTRTIQQKDNTNWYDVYNSTGISSIPSVRTLYDLKVLASRPSLVVVLSRMSGEPIGDVNNDGAGGLFLWAPQSSITADDYDVVAPANPPLGRWIRANDRLLMKPVILTASSTLYVNSTVGLDTRQGVISLALPSAPQIGDWVEFFDPFGSWNVNKPSLTGNGNSIEGSGNLFRIDVSVPFRMRYVGDSTGWKAETVVLPGQQGPSGNDGRSFFAPSSSITFVANAYTLVLNDFGKTQKATTGSSNVTVTMPAASGVPNGTMVTIVKADSGTGHVLVKDDVAADIRRLMTQNDYVRIRCTGGVWEVDASKIAPIFRQYTDAVTPATWTKYPGLTRRRTIAWGAGGGGGSGRQGAAGSARFGGGGGCAGSYVEFMHLAGDLPATETITIAAGGAGGTAISTTSTDGNAGAAGGNTSVGSTVLARGGAAGSGGTASAGTGGAAPAGSTMRTLSGGAASSATAIPTTPNSSTAGSGGGGGGISTGDTEFAGGTGGNGSAPCVSSLGGGAGGAIAANGSPGNSPSSTSNQEGGSGGGGGGASKTQVAGTGGAGGNCGAGGGGASLNGFNSGAGGVGGRGEVRIWEFYD